jgi:hypothetical protein
MLLAKPVGVRICSPIPAALVVKYVFPAPGTAPLLQFVEPVMDEVPSASFVFNVTLAAVEARTLDAKSKQVINGSFIAEKNRLAGHSDWLGLEVFILL